jgi:hypothetical protein
MRLRLQRALHQAGRDRMFNQMLIEIELTFEIVAGDGKPAETEQE